MADQPEQRGGEGESVPEGARSPNDAPGAPSATTGDAGTSGPANQPGSAGTDRAPTEEQRAESDGNSAAPEGAGEADRSVHGCPAVEDRGVLIVHCDPARYHDLCRDLRAEGYLLPALLTGVDYLTHPGRVLPDGVRKERFEVVTELIDLERRRRVRIRCQVPEGAPNIPSIYDLFPGTEFHERETYDMFGIRFDGHPDLARLLMPDDWEGHPLRKDYDTGHVPVQFKEVPR